MVKGSGVQVFQYVETCFLILRHLCKLNVLRHRYALQNVTHPLYIHSVHTDTKACQEMVKKGFRPRLWLLHARHPCAMQTTHDTWNCTKANDKNMNLPSISSNEMAKYCFIPTLCNAASTALAAVDTGSCEQNITTLPWWMLHLLH